MNKKEWIRKKEKVKLAYKLAGKVDEAVTRTHPHLKVYFTKIDGLKALVVEDNYLYSQSTVGWEYGITSNRRKANGDIILSRETLFYDILSKKYGQLTKDTFEEEYTRIINLINKCFLDTETSFKLKIIKDTLIYDFDRLGMHSERNETNTEIFKNKLKEAREKVDEILGVKYE